MAFTLYVYDGDADLIIGPFSQIKDLLTLGGPELTPFISDSMSNNFHFELRDGAGLLFTVEIEKNAPFADIMKRLNVFNPAFFNPGTEQ